MRVGWLQDYNIFSASGGAEQSDLAVFKEGLNRGYEMQLLTPESSMGLVDLLVISNATRANSTSVVQACRQVSFVFYIHDYWPLCRWRLYYPGKRCTENECGDLDYAKFLTEESLLNVFLSPLHLDSWALNLPDVKEHPHHLHPSPVDTKHFTEHGVPRMQQSALGANCLLSFKGRDAVLEYARKHSDMTFTFIGGTDGEFALPTNCGYLGAVGFEQLPEMYNQAEAYIHLPQTPQPYERTIAEARLCGIKQFIVNDMVGAASYKWWKAGINVFRKRIKEAPGKWWEEVEKCL